MKMQKTINKLSLLLAGFMFFTVSIANATKYYPRLLLSGLFPFANSNLSWTTNPSGLLGPSPDDFNNPGDLFIIQNGQALSTNGSWAVAGSVQILSGGSLALGADNSYSLNIGGTMEISGTLTLNNTSTKTFTGNVTVSNGGVFTISGNQTINANKDLTVSSGGILNQTVTSTLSIAGNFLNNGVYNSAGTGGAKFNIAGNFTNNNTFTTTSASTVTFNGSGNSVIDGTATTNFYNLILNKTASNLTLTNSSTAFNVTNDLTVTKGNLVLAATDKDYTFSKNVIVATGGTLTHSVSWDGAGKKIGIGGNLEVTGVFNPTVRSHVQLNGSGTHTIQTGPNAASTLSILTLVTGDFKASGPLKTNQEAWVMAGTDGSFTTNGKDVTLGSLLSDKGTITVPGGTLTVNGYTQIDFEHGGTMKINGGTVNLNGNFTINTLGSVTCSNSPQINITGNWTNSGAFTPASSTVSFKGTGNQQIGGTTSNNFNNLIINPSAGVTVSSVSNNIVINSNLTVSTGIFDLTTYTCNRSAAGGIFSLAAGTLLKAAGANNFPQSFSTNTLNVNSTVEYYGTVAQSVFPVTYGNLTVSNNSTKTATGAVKIAGNLNINSSAVFAGSSYAHTIAGNWYNNVSASGYSPGTSTFTFNGSSAQTIGGTAPTTFNKLTVNNASGVSISQDQTVNSTLTLSAGRLNVGTKIFTFGSSASAVAGTFSASTMIVADGGGEVRKNYSSPGSYSFPVGDITGTAEYSPITLNYTSGTFAAGAYSGVKVINAKSPSNASSTDYLKRYWSVSNSGITAPSFTATAKYVAADIAGTESNISSAKYAGTAPWTRYGIVSSSTVTTTAINNTGTGIVISGITNQLPTVSIPSTGYCTGGSVVLNPTIANGTSSMTYAWSPATGLSSTTIANPTATPLSSTTYTLTVTDGNGFTKSASVTLSQYASGSWAGVVSSDWDDPANWVCGPIPTSAIDVAIPAGLNFYPVIIAGIDYAKNITIQPGASLTIAGGILKISGIISNNGTFDATAGTIEMNGTSAQNISGSMFVNKTIQNLIVSNTSGTGLSVSSTTGDTLKITGALTFGSGTSKLNTGDNLTFVSNSLGTARLGTVAPGNTITGKVIVERYINTGTGAGQHGKSWQFLSAPTYGQTIKESWMENGNLPGNYGTMISGPGGIAAGFDMYSVAPSMKYFDLSITGNWKGVSGANDIISNTGGYMVFIRGDRTVTSTSAPANSTVLRTKGTLFTGDQPSIIVKAGKFQSVGNPYASPIDFALITKDASIDDAFYVFDPYLYGTYGVGGYQALSSISNWKPVPGGTLAYPITTFSSVIQSGQAFFVHSSSAVDGSLTIKEDCKSSVSRSGHSSRVAAKVAEGTRQFLNASLLTANGLMADGNLVAFDKTFKNNTDGVIKMINSGENFAVKSAGKLLAIEAKSQLSSDDTIYYNVSNLSKTNYKLIFAPENMESSDLQAFLVDKFLNSETPVSLTDSTLINISVTSDDKSSAPDRFKIVFRQMPATITSITATPKDASNLVQGAVENESSILQFQVEKSTDGNHFTEMAIVNANNTINTNYTVADKKVSDGINYYRVKIVSVGGKPTYTSIVKVNNEQQPGNISVYPNPVNGDVIHLQFNRQPAGNYQMKLYNAAGQVLISKAVNHTEGNSSEDIKCDNLPKGAYQLMINTPGGKKENIRVIK